MISLAGFLLLLLLAAASGRTLLQLLRLEPDSAVERIIYGTPIGLAIIAYLVLILGLAGLLSVVPVSVALLGLAVLSSMGFRGLWSDLRSRDKTADSTIEPIVNSEALPESASMESSNPRSPDVDECPAAYRKKPRFSGLLPIACGIILAASGLIALVNCFVPPGANEWDAVSYHLAAPKVYLEHQRIVYLPTDHHSNFPFTMQMLFLLGLMFDGFALANLIHFATAVLTAAAILVIAHKRLGHENGWVAAAVFATCPMAVWEAGAAYVELGFALFVLTAVGALIEFRITRETRWFVLASLLIGFALSVKTLALIPLAIMIGLLVLWRIPVRRFALFLLLAAAIGSPFYLKSWVVTGNPVYPFGYRLFGGRDWSAELAETYASEHRAFGQSAISTGVVDDVNGERIPYQSPRIGERIRNLALAPFELAAMPRIFHNFNNPGLHSHLGFLVVVLPAMLIFARNPSSVAKLLAAFCAVWFVIWSQSMQYARYLLPVTPVVGLFGGEAAILVGRRSLILALLLTAAIGLQAGITLVKLGARVPEKLTIAINSEARDKYLTSSVNVYAAQKWLNANTKPNDGVILFEETRGFYLDRPYLWGNGPHSLHIPYHEFANGQAMANWFTSKGYRYGILNLQFSPALKSTDDQRRMREASAEGTTAGLVRDWYADSARLEEIRSKSNDPNSPDYAPNRFRDVYWRLLLGDAVANGGAVVIPDASSRGAVVLEFTPTP